MSFATLILAVVLGVNGGLRLKHANQGRLEPFMFWAMLFFVGITGLYSGVYHCFTPQLAAETIGWSDSPFQWEVGIANFAIGVLGVMGAWASRSFRWAVVVALCVWFWGNAIGHVWQMGIADNCAPGKAGSWFWVDVFGPFILFIAHALNRGDKRLK
jgi:hypothetical protein